MAEFSIPLLLVANTGTLGAGATNTLTGGQIGVYDNTYAVGSAGTIATKPYIYIAEGRIESIPGVGSKRSDKIGLGNIIEWYKVVAIQNNVSEIAVISNFTNVLCQQDITFTVVLHSSYIDSQYWNGLTRSVTVTSACCNCGTAPCTALVGQDIQNLVDGAVALFNRDTLLANYLTFSRVGTLGASTLVITELPLTVYGQACDLAVNPFEWDAIRFRGFVIANAPTTQDFQVLQACSQVATVTITQRSSYLAGTAAEIQQLEKNYYSYQTPLLKALYRQSGWNEIFTSYVGANAFFDTYYLTFSTYKSQSTFTDVVEQRETVIIAFPTGTGGTFETLLVAFAGAIQDKSATNATTTSTTSTTSTSTTSTTTLFP